MNTTSGSDDLLTVTEVVTETGLSADTLRVWERRYGFPQPVRDNRGRRRYPRAQVDRLRQIKRLVDAGFRPGKLVGALRPVVAKKPTN
jgi:DNA-binding transcriptional MerR regulator